ncbi:hypothetical protein [Mesoplasma lactucae]|uniref:Uncharacterized protein n=1 Tax=Mesoplasma lactucae ATCC 49193 TaxID=81460 RepID=A0A291IQZ3_9MOLU|nr:hypothetical protein [Mesoplasma lactucae]ATG97154.1 hypothetical protein CP520_00030 [Mesoplasma lactucae ATCC 49193]ATZ20407.1 hypothetical protein MLACT_v1c05860 [Mesoplasma lactucae ATCC 49193]MCL8216578.1 hypothetical protein [Mesoplasma lactucae ATCC 49193]
MNKINQFFQKTWKWVLVVLFLATGVGLTLAFTPFHPKIDEEPQFALGSDVMGYAEPSRKAWTNDDKTGVIDTFNEYWAKEHPELPKIHAYYETKSTYTKIAAGYQLPDLILTRPGNVRQYAVSEAKNQIREFNNLSTINETFLPEFNFENRQIGAPIFKSFNVNIVNAKVYKQLTGKDWVLNKTFTYDEVLDLLKVWDSRPDLSRDEKGNKIPMLGFDDFTYQIFENQATGTGAYKPNENFVFDYKTTGTGDNFDMKFNVKDGDYFQKIMDSGYFIGAPVNSGQKTYTSVTMRKGKMLMSSCSTAGLFPLDIKPYRWSKTKNEWVANQGMDDGNKPIAIPYPEGYKLGKMQINQNSKQYQKWIKDGNSKETFNPNKDNESLQPNDDEFGQCLNMTADTTRSGELKNWSRTLGLAGFKSVGKNASLKEATVNGFIDYVLSGDKLNKLALAANYVPTTTIGYEAWKETKLNGTNALDKKYAQYNPLEKNVYFENNPADTFAYNTLNSMWTNNYLPGRGKNSFYEVFNYENFVKYTNFGDLYNKSKVIN